VRQLPADKLHHLSSIDIFQDLSPAELERIESRITMTTCEPGRIFYMPEESGEVLFLLKTGRVQLYRLSPAGKKLVIGTIEPGTFFGEMSLVGQGMHNAFAEAGDKCLLCVMSRSDVERLMHSHPEVALRFVEALGRRLMEVEAGLEEIAFKSIPGRLAGLLLERMKVVDGVMVVEGYTHQDLAEMIGTYRETVTQTLNEFRQEGLIEIGRKRLAILDPDGLSAVSQR
jgi:CRP/FNR family transcriptional regulator, cyclic AMP receptor protein